MSDLPPLLRVRFTPGEAVNDEEINRFNTFLSRLEGETSMSYAQRLSQAGLARVTTSEQMRDIAAFRALSDEAEYQGVPVIVVTSSLTDPRETAARPVPTLDDLIDRKTGMIREAQVHASGDAGADRDAIHTDATKAATKDGAPGHSAEAK